MKLSQVLTAQEWWQEMSFRKWLKNKRGYSTDRLDSYILEGAD